VTTARRLDHLEDSLSPQEAVLRWLAEAHEFPTLPDYVQSLKGQPPSVFPLYRLPEEMEASVRAGLKGEKRERIVQAVRAAVRDAAFLVYLVTQTNTCVLTEQRANSLTYFLVSQGLKGFLKGSTAWEGQEQERWCGFAESLVSEVFTLQGAIAQIATTYFRGQTPLFPETAGLLAQLVTVTAGISESYHRSLALGLFGPKPKGKRRQTPPIDLNQVREAAAASANVRAQAMITLAQAEALTMMGEHDRGLDLVEARIL
jgi:hypothetical protein